jgi:predicted esterase
MQVGATVARNGLYRAQTPQGFRFTEILAAHRAAAAAGRDDFTDDSAVAEWHGLRVAIVEGAEINRKLTTVADIRQADREFRDGSWDGQERLSGFTRRALRPGTDPARLLYGAADDPAAAAIAAALLRAARLPAARTTPAEAARRVREAGGAVANVALALHGAGLDAAGLQPARMVAWIAEALAIEAVEQVDAALASGQPFFLNFAPYSVHTPIQPNPRYVANYAHLDPREAAYASMVETMDAALGAVLEELEPIASGQGRERYQALADGLAQGAAALAAFFDGDQSVLVMVDDPAVRRNRLNLLGLLRNQASVLAEFEAING